MESRGLRGLMYLVVVVTASAGSFAAQNFADTQSFSITSLDSEDFPVDSDFSSSFFSQWQLEKIGNEFSNPTQILSPEQNTAVDLPAVPATITLTLCGFLCVSLVRDRRAWFALVAGILWLGNSGIHVIPELNQKLCARISDRISSPAGPDLPAVFMSSDDVTGNSPVTRFIGLLRKLEGIPARHNQNILSGQFCSITASTRKVGNYCVWSGGAPDGSATSQARLEQFNCNERQIVCPVSAAGYFIVFEPAFIFSNLSRGPPARDPESIV